MITRLLNDALGPRWPVPFVALALAACGGGGGSDVTHVVRFSLATQPAATAAAQSAARSSKSIEVDGGGHTLVIDSVQVVLRELELNAVGETLSCDDDGADCAEMEMDPMLADLPLTPGPAQQFSVTVPAGSYDAIEFKMHALTLGDDADQMMLLDHPEMNGHSFRVTGTFDGTPFVFVSSLEESQEYAIAPPLVVTGDVPALLTLFVDVATWFVDGSDQPIDPATANAGQPNESMVADNIRNSFAAFDDDDHDGEPDG